MLEAGRVRRATKGGSFELSRTIVDPPLLCYIIITVLHYHYCVTLSLLCYIIITVLHYHYCVTLSLLCYIITTVLHYHYCVTLSLLCYISYQVYVVTRDNEREKDQCE